MEDVQKIFIKLRYKVKREAINQLKKQYKKSFVMKKLKKIEEELPANY